MKNTNKRNKLYDSDWIVKSTFTQEPGWYVAFKGDNWCDGKGPEDEHKQGYVYHRIIAFAVIENWRYGSENDAGNFLPSQDIAPIIATLEMGAQILHHELGDPNDSKHWVVFLPDERRSVFFNEDLYTEGRRLTWNEEEPL